MSDDQRRKISRRRLLLAASAAAAAAATGAAWFSGARPVTAGPLLDRLRRDLAPIDLQVTEADVESFLADYRAAGEPLPRAMALMDDAEFETIASRFLMSTDFFLGGGDLSRPATYAQFYDPYANPNWNPIAIHAEQSAAPVG